MERCKSISSLRIRAVLGGFSVEEGRLDSWRCLDRIHRGRFGRPESRVPSSGSLVSTFSIVARDPSNGELGVAVQSKCPNVRVAVPYAKAGVGAVATQSFSNSDFGTKGLQLLELGATPQEVLSIIGRDDSVDQGEKEAKICDW